MCPAAIRAVPAINGGRAESSPTHPVIARSTPRALASRREATRQSALLYLGYGFPRQCEHWLGMTERNGFPRQCEHWLGMTEGDGSPWVQSALGMTALRAGGTMAGRRAPRTAAGCGHPAVRWEYGGFFHKQEKVTENGESNAIFCGGIGRKGLDKQGKFAIMQVSGQSRARPAFRRFVPPDKTTGSAEI